MLAMMRLLELQGDARQVLGQNCVDVSTLGTCRDADRALSFQAVAVAAYHPGAFGCLPQPISAGQPWSRPGKQPGERRTLVLSAPAPALAAHPPGRCYHIGAETMVPMGEDR